MMRNHSKTRLWMGAGLAPLLALACASTAPTQSVVEARQTFQLTAQDPQVKQHASEQLYEAEQANARMERALKRGSDETEVDHFAYLTKKRSEIAQAVAEEGALKAQSEQLGRRRDQLRIDASKAETAEARAAARTATAIAAQQGEEIADLRERTADAEQEAADAKQEAFAMARKLELASKENERGLVITLGDVLFQTGKASLASGAQRTLSRVAELLEAYPDRSVIVEGHTDDVGSETYNQSLSQQRAQSVTDALIADGVPATRFQVRGLGESSPTVPNTDAASRQQNRRVEIVLSPVAAVD